MSIDETSRKARQRPTMKDVAAAAAVSLKTVSRVVNDEPGVRPDKQQAVERAIVALGFSRNYGAAMLRHGQSSSIGLIVEDSAEPFQATLGRAIERVALEHDSLLFVASSAGTSERERLLVQALASRRVDGLLVVPSNHPHDYLRIEIQSGVPVVFVDRPVPGIAADTVLTDNVGGAIQAVRHLIDHGHRRIAIIADLPDIFTANERFEGYQTALRAAGLEYDPSLVFRNAPTDRDSIAECVVRALDREDPATALFTGNSFITVATLRALKGCSHRPALVGFDDFELADLLTPGISVVAQDAWSMGTHAAELLFKRIHGDQSPTVQIRLATALIPRGSGEVGL
ncbi:MAG TPA: LacI family DNA-binding transcriptional regulator [Ktedonobacterales bacterium]|nr:LacI family DNA-binding transcriptional regulator [Ktedonobacterales bacterium]